MSPRPIFTSFGRGAADEVLFGHRVARHQRFESLEARDIEQDSPADDFLGHLFDSVDLGPAGADSRGVLSVPHLAVVEYMGERVP